MSSKSSDARQLKKRVLSKHKVISHDYHRNGVCGAPFNVCVFVDSETGRRMVGVVFASEGHVAVLDIDLLNANNVAFGENSWRGDHFEDFLRLATGTPSGRN